MAHRILRDRAEVATGNAYADWVRTKSEAFRSEGITRLLAGIGIAGTSVYTSNRASFSSWASKINE
jgi:hypothetical protein